MNRDDGGGGGPFMYYPVTGGAIRDAAGESDGPAGEIDAVRRQLEDEHRRMVRAVEGDLAAPMVEAPAATQANLERVAQASRFAAGVLRLFADAVDEFNHHSVSPRSVDGLNAAYAEARLADFGLDSADYDKGGPAAGRDFGADWQNASEALVGPGGSLTREYQRLEEQLDAWADHAARMLDRGPNPDDIRELWSSGALPTDAAELWPGLDLNNVPVFRLPYEYRDEVGDRSLSELSDDELLELADEGYEPAGELLGDRVAHDFENHTALNEFNLSMNLAYIDAQANGMPEWFARRLAKIYPVTILDINLAPFAAAGELGYALTARDLVEAFKADPFSLRTLGELAMVLPAGRLAKVRDLDNVLETIDAGRDARHLDVPATSAAQGVRLRGYLTAEMIADGHAYKKHIGEFGDLGIESRQQFARHIESVVNDPSEIRELSKGRRAYWDEDTGTVVIHNPDAPDGGTALIPKDGYDYFVETLN